MMKLQIFLVLLFSFIYGLLSAPEGIYSKDVERNVARTSLFPRPSDETTQAGRITRSTTHRFTPPQDPDFCDVAALIVEWLGRQSFDHPLYNVSFSVNATAEIR
ncbi:hypothetical protein Avbf_18360 [Armadillidium vulgare]|nr:hypothetical protein Avbf_18360 [Armadillidium vulgare]